MGDEEGSVLHPQGNVSKLLSSITLSHIHYIYERA